MTGFVPTPAVALLESDERLEYRYPGIPIFEIAGDFDVDIFDSFDAQHTSWCKDDALCTSDGFRWHPSLLPLRFT